MKNYNLQSDIKVAWCDNALENDFPIGFEF